MSKLIKLKIFHVNIIFRFVTKLLLLATKEKTNGNKGNELINILLFRGLAGFSTIQTFPINVVMKFKINS